jgi:hypothetical protein
LRFIVRWQAVDSKRDDATMSLGFLTESALVPSKATPIKVDAQSLVDLKAVVFQKDQERQRRLRDALGAGETSANASAASRGLGKYAHLRGKSRKRGGSASLSLEEDRLGKRGASPNRGVEKRSRRDLEVAELEVSDRDNDAALARKSRAMLEKKARLYDEMMRGHGPVEAAASEFLVDFGSKRLASSEAEDRSASQLDEADAVEIVDEFGRSRLVPRGSSAHLEFLDASRRESPQHQQDDERSDDRTRDEEESAAERQEAGSSFVVSQWEHRLNAAEKTYLRQVHERVELAKAAAPSAGATKMSKKKLRLEKLRQERAKAVAAKNSPGVSTTGSDAASKPRDAPAVNDAAVSAQATDFLNQMSSLM